VWFKELANCILPVNAAFPHIHVPNDVFLQACLIEEERLFSAS